MTKAGKAVTYATLWVLPILIAAAALTAFVHRELREVHDKVLCEASEVSGAQWSRYFTRHLPDLERLFRDGVVTPEQTAVFTGGFAMGEAFGVKLFKPDGTVIYYSVSEDLPVTIPAEAEAARAVFVSGKPIVNLHDGTGIASRPDRYAEAFIPVASQRGERIGVMEVYLDQTPIAMTLSNGFSRIIRLLPLLCGAALLIPALAFAFVKGQKRAQEDDLDAARFDPLTSVFNRRGFTEAQQALFDRLAVTGETVAVMFIDLDDFKDINDTLGHATGDAFLAHVARQIRASLRDRDLVGRFGGDEFVVILPGVSEVDLRHAGTRILAAVSQPTLQDGQTLRGAVSIGATLADPEQSFDAILARADDALYEAKKTGRNRMTLSYPDGRLEQVDRVA